MKKGTVVGGRANGNATDKTPRGMLPPTGNGPIEVTRETLGEATGDNPVEAAVPKQAASPTLADLVPAAVRDILTADLPEAGEPAEVIVACEKRLYAANALLDAMQKKTLNTYFDYAGPAVRLAWATESWRACKDPDTGNPCRSWSAWLRIVKVSRQHAYRMTKEEPIREALTGLDVGKLGVRQIDALSPVLTNFGQKAVREVWTSALGWGDTAAPSLLKVRRQLGYEPDRQISEGEEESTASSSDLPVLRFQTKPGTFDARLVREVARAQPDIALLVAKEIFSELGVEPEPVSRDTGSTD
ncbi:hypothetical protein ACFW2V_12635 [Streptomyces sp. NPDC058947]|uniref:hypothetical protein n=1 Tax=Streptomyces sp. NPDC058947 TaxID=3346675 RepID=UPI0036A35BD2